MLFRIDRKTQHVPSVSNSLPKWLSKAIDAPVKKRKPYLEGALIPVWMPFLEGQFPVIGPCLYAPDPPADKDAFDSKILDILRSRRSTFRTGDVIAELQKAGYGKEKKALSCLVPQSLRRLKTRGLAHRGGMYWIAASYPEGTM